ncbi:AGAP003009-PA-like protein [Anopheles sinensis]|uniref:AGAP003009-PA-like protein n=1 Tax=Anopheles sinensis TaxID=74873 RepID=A0A084VRA5_ANOSI|nr:AGAP003009-PA-like protein [Anopheles sinensis]
MLLPFDGTTVERFQRSHFKADHRKDRDDSIVLPSGPPRSAKLAARYEDIANTIVSSVAFSDSPVSTVSAPNHPHVAASMAAHGNSTPPVAMVTTARAPTDPPARKVDILIYPTVSPETIVVPILSCIVGFPIFALLVICCLRRRAKIARERDRRRNFDLQANTITLVRFNSHHRKYPALARG